jgi:hypothetical protein
VRVSTAFNRLLQIPGASVIDVAIEERDVEVFLRPRARLLHCPCGKQVRAVYDRRRRRNMAAYESEHKADRIRSAHRQIVENGGWKGRHPVLRL